MSNDSKPNNPLLPFPNNREALERLPGLAWKKVGHDLQTVDTFDKAIASQYLRALGNKFNEFAELELKPSEGRYAFVMNWKMKPIFERIAGNFNLLEEPVISKLTGEGEEFSMNRLSENTSPPPLRLTESDKKFLRALKIAWEPQPSRDVTR